MAVKNQILLAAIVLLLSAIGRADAGEKQWDNNATCTNPASGTLYGAPFKMERADYNNSVLSLRQGRDRQGANAARLAIKFPKPMDLEGTRFMVQPDGKATVYLPNKTQTSLNGLSVTKTTNGSPGSPKSGSLIKNYTLSLQFYQPTKTLLPGYIEFKSLDDGSTVRGYFFAERGKDGDGFY
jgi:hypothetical protein